MIIAKTIGIGTSGMDNDNINEQKENGSDQESGSENGDKDNVQNEQHGQHGSVNGLDMQGVVQNLNTATSTFTLNGKQVTYTPATVFKGLSGTTLANGLLVEAEGAYDANKSFVATEIKAEGKEAN
jgi:cytochrome c-type biogenesis protein CcmE